FELWIVSFDDFGRRVFDFYIRRDAFVLDGPPARKIIEREYWRSNPAAVDCGWNAQCADQASPCASADHWPKLAEMEHIWQGVATGASRLVDDHHLRSINAGDRRSRRLAVALDEVTHQFSIQFVHDVVRDLSAVIVTLVDDRAVLVLLRIVITSEVRVARAPSVWQPNVSQPPIGKLINYPAIVF